MSSQLTVHGASIDDLQVLLDRVVASYARRVEMDVDDGVEPPAPLPESRESTATDVVITVNMLLQACGLSPFELSLLTRF